MDIFSLTDSWSLFVGAGALIALIVNVLKTFGVVKDGQAAIWSTGLNIVGLVALYVLNTVSPEANLSLIDETAGSLAEALYILFNLFVQLGGAKLMHTLIKGVPVIGKSNSI